VLPHYFASEIALSPTISAKPKSSGQTILMTHLTSCHPSQIRKGAKKSNTQNINEQTQPKKSGGIKTKKWCVSAPPLALWVTETPPPTKEKS